jgi:hypothetical protein
MLLPQNLVNDDVMFVFVIGAYWYEWVPTGKKDCEIMEMYFVTTA